MPVGTTVSNVPGQVSDGTISRHVRAEVAHQVGERNRESVRRYRAGGSRASSVWRESLGRSGSPMRVGSPLCQGCSTRRMGRRWPPHCSPPSTRPTRGQSWWDHPTRHCCDEHIGLVRGTCRRAPTRGGASRSCESSGLDKGDVMNREVALGHVWRARTRSPGHGGTDRWQPLTRRSCKSALRDVPPSNCWRRQSCAAWCEGSGRCRPTYTQSIPTTCRYYPPRWPRLSRARSRPSASRDRGRGSDRHVGVVVGHGGSVCLVENDAPVLCHGDFHPLNALVDGDGHIGIVDWTDACVCDRHHDVGRSIAIFWFRVVDRGERSRASRAAERSRPTGPAAPGPVASETCLRSLLTAASFCEHWSRPEGAEHRTRDAEHTRHAASAPNGHLA